MSGSERRKEDLVARVLRVVEVLCRSHQLARRRVEGDDVVVDAGVDDQVAGATTLISIAASGAWLCRQLFGAPADRLPRLGVQV